MKELLGWQKGDWGAYFGLLANNLTNYFTMSGLLIFTVGLPAEFVYTRIAPGFGLAIFISSFFYWYAGKNLIKKTGRTDVTALPSGPSAPSIFLVIFLVILPIARSTGDPYFALKVALGWCFLEALIELSGAFIGDWLRRIIPRSVLLACLGGLGIMLLAMNPMLQSFEAPLVSFVVLAIIFINWFGKKALFPRIPTGFLLLAVGTILAWVFGQMDVSAIVPLVGGTVEEAMNFTLEMLEITTTTNPNVTIPIHDFMGIPTGIDVRKVIEKDVLPIINTAIAHKEAGIGMIGAGITHPPFEAFEKALEGIVERMAE